VVVVLAIAGGVIGYRYYKKAKSAVSYRSVRVERGDIVQTVRATGNIQPMRLVDVGTQVNGPVKKLYVDFNDRVKAGDLVAQIDPTVYEARLAQDEANLVQSKASVEQTVARLTQADKELERSKTLASRDMISQSDLDTVVANRDALAAQEKVARAAVEQAEASLRLSKANLGYTTIESPVDGIVISRNASEGQTVVASMSAQVLFEIAADLRDVQVEASIPEADVGKIRAGQPVSFTVDAYDETFTGEVSQVRLAAATVQNVVTYPVIVKASNPEDKLFPGMTANIACEVDRRTAVLKVPNAALRFKPEATKASKKKAGTETRPDKGRGGPQIWVLSKPGATPVAVNVRTGIGDGSATEVCEPSDLKEGQVVATGVMSKEEAKSAVVNPFIPSPPPRGQRRIMGH